MTSMIARYILLLVVGLVFSGITAQSVEQRSPSSFPTPQQDHRKLLRPIRHVGRGNDTRMFGGGAKLMKMENQGHFCEQKAFAQGQDPSDGQARWLYDLVFHRLELYDKQRSIPHKPKTFVEFGARDGCKESNSYWLEKNFFWQGILIDAGRDYIEPLRNQRDCRCHNKPGACVWAALAARVNETLFWNSFDRATKIAKLDKYHQEEVDPTAKDREVKTTTLPILLDRFRLTEVNLISADCEGCEFDALLGLAGVLGRSVSVDVFVVEHPAGERPRPDCRLLSFLHQHHYMAVPLPFSYDVAFLHSSVIQRLGDLNEGLHPLFFDPQQHCYGSNNHNCKPEILDEKYQRLMRCEVILKEEGTLKEDPEPVPLYWLHNSTAGWPKLRGAPAPASSAP